MRDKVALVTLLLVALAAAAPLWGPGIVNTRGGGDSPFLLQRTEQMLVNLRAGVFPVRWMPDAAYGQGYPFYNHYSALPYYVAGLLAWAGVDLLTAIKITQTLGFLASALAMYGWMCAMAKDRWKAWLAAVAYTVAPFHLVNVYVRGDSLSEFYAFVFFPLVLWGLAAIAESKPQASGSRRTARWLGAGIAYAGLILSHNISALIFSPFLLLYLLTLILRARADGRRVLALGSLAIGLGLLLSAWVWLPALAEIGFVQAENLTDDYFHYSRHFRQLDLVQQRLSFSYSVSPGRDSPFAMGLPQAGFAAFGALAIVARALRHKGQSKTGSDPWERECVGWVFVLVGLLISTAMITPLSKFLWDHLPLLPMTQFPWRFLSVQALFAAAATALLVPGQRWRKSTGLLLAVILVASVLVPLDPDRLAISPSDVTTERLQLYELFTQNIGTTIRYEWLPQDVVPRPFTSGALVEPEKALSAVPLDGARLEAALVQAWPTKQEWRAWGEGGAIAFPVLYWPGWGAWLDGGRVDVAPVQGAGYLALSVPPGEHFVLLRLGRTPLRAAAEVVSLCALVVVVFLLVRAWRQVPWRSVVRWLSLVVLPVLSFALLAQPEFHSDDLTMDFDQMPMLHHNPGGVNFDGVVRLLGYALSSDEPRPGDALTVTPRWTTATDAYTATLRLVSPAALRHDVEPLAEATGAAGASPELVLKLPDDVPRGVYLLQLRLFSLRGELRPRTPSGKARGSLYLRPVRVSRGPAIDGDAAVLAPFGPAIRLHTVTINQLGPDGLRLRLGWSTERPVAANYGISLRLLDREDQVVAVLDTQPGYGFLPTGMWRPGELIVDRYLLSIPENLPPGDGYHLLVILYQVSTGEVVGQVRLGDFQLPLDSPFEAHRPPRSFSLPALPQVLEVDFGGQVRLAGHTLEVEDDRICLTLWWQALQSPTDDYTVFVHLFDPAKEMIVVQSDAMPQDGRYPTSWWVAGEVVSETLELSTRDVPMGEYQIAVGLYDRIVTRLPASEADGQPVPNDRVILPERVEIAR